jgi:hypothetical protein
MNTNPLKKHQEKHTSNHFPSKNQTFQYILATPRPIRQRAYLTALRALVRHVLRANDHRGASAKSGRLNQKNLKLTMNRCGVYSCPEHCYRTSLPLFLVEVCRLLRFRLEKESFNILDRRYQPSFELAPVSLHRDPVIPNIRLYKHMLTWACFPSAI